MIRSQLFIVPLDPISLSYTEVLVSSVTVSGQLQSFSSTVSIVSAVPYPAAKSGQTFNAYVRGL